MNTGTAIATSRLALPFRYQATKTIRMCLTKPIRRMARWHQCQHVATGGTC